MDQENKRAYLTTSEVADRLGVTKKTIYNYIQSKKLIPVYEKSWGIDQTLLFKESDVLVLKEKKEKPGLTTGDVAKELGVHPVTVGNYIKRGELAATKRVYNGKMSNFIYRDDLDHFKNTRRLNDKKNGKRFYSADKNLYLFQTLINRKKTEIARVMELDGNGLVKTESGEVFSLSESNQRGYEPKERFAMAKHITKHGYVTFRFVKPNHVASPILDLMEAVYRAIGYNNIRLQLRDDYIHLEVKPFLFTELEGESNRYLVQILQDNLEEGDLVVRHDGLLVDSGLERLTIYLPTDINQKLKDKIKLKKVATYDYILNLLKNDLN